MQEIQALQAKAQEYVVTDLRSLLPLREGLDPKKGARPTAQILLDRSRQYGCEIYYSLDNWLDWLIDVFDSQRYVDETWHTNLESQATEQPEFYDLLHRWVNQAYDAKDNGKPIDFFGNVYEENFQTGHKATTLGQFYTPMDLGLLLSSLTVRKEEKGARVMDCACGSGRLLLSGAKGNDFRRDTFYFGGDVDPQSCKMCALNLMIYGLQGVVLQQNALLQDEPKAIYAINRVDYPAESGFRSITRLTTDEAVEQGILIHHSPLKDLKLEQYTLNDAYMDWHRKLLHDYNKPSMPQKAVQLSLWH